MSIRTGDRVRAIVDDRNVAAGMVGTVIGVQGDDPSVLVRWDDWEGNGCTGKQYAGYCDDTKSSAWVNRETVEKLDGLRVSSPITKGYFMDGIVQIARRLALKVTAPDEYELRKAGLVDDCGHITSAGVELLQAQLIQDEDIRAGLVEVAKAINVEREAKK